MRTSVMVALTLLMAVILAGTLTEGHMERLASRYISAAEELQALTQQENWQRAGEVVESYIRDWRDRVPALQTLINHEDADEVTLALMTLQAAIEAQDKAGCLMACAELREHAEHLHHRDALNWGNVL